MLRSFDIFLRIGVDKVLNSAAVKDPVFLKKLVEIYGASYCLPYSKNIETDQVNGKYKVFIETGRVNTGIDLVLIGFEKVQILNVGEIIITDIFAEGKNNGFNTNLFKEVRKNVDTQLVAHGGAGQGKTFWKCLKNVMLMLFLLHLYFIIIT